MPGVPKKFTGWAAMDKEAGQKFDVKSWEFEPTAWVEDCVDIQVDACGICGSCIHTITDGWGGTKYPCIVGHEIVGHVVRAGKDTEHKVGDRVGVGAQGGACLKCDMCKQGHENYCQGGSVGTYQGKLGDGAIAQGGYANFHRTKGHFAIPIPKELDSAVAAPMMCGGVTTYTPLVTFGAGPGKDVAIVGVGVGIHRLGHFGLLWAKALGANVHAISHSASKQADAEKMGVPKENFIVANDVAATVKKWGHKLDLIVCTSFQKDMPISQLYMKLLRPMGTLCFVGVPEEDLPRIAPGFFNMSGVRLAGSSIGSPQQIRDMLQLAVKHNIQGWIEKRPMSECGAALKDLADGKPRYRYVLMN